MQLVFWKPKFGSVISLYKLQVYNSRINNQSVMSTSQINVSSCAGFYGSMRWVLLEIRHRALFFQGIWLIHLFFYSFTKLFQEFLAFYMRSSILVSHISLRIAMLGFWFLKTAFRDGA